MARKKRARLSPLTVIGELLLLGGLGVLGYIVWQPWYALTVVANSQQVNIDRLTSEWTPEVASQEELPVPEVNEGTEPWGVMYAPALGDTWAYRIADGVGRPDPLDDIEKGVGRYTETDLPGQIGNFALAAHRNTTIAPFRNIEYLRIGDEIYIETKDGWYTYVYRNAEVVTPDTTEVLNDFPYQLGGSVQDSTLTLTSCYPKDGAALRLIAFANFEGFTPRADGPPEKLAQVNPSVGSESGAKTGVGSETAS